MLDPGHCPNSVLPFTNSVLERYLKDVEVTAIDSLVLKR